MGNVLSNWSTSGKCRSIRTAGCGAKFGYAIFRYASGGTASCRSRSLSGSPKLGRTIPPGSCRLSSSSFACLTSRRRSRPRQSQGQECRFRAMLNEPRCVERGAEIRRAERRPQASVSKPSLPCRVWPGRKLHVVEEDRERRTSRLNSWSNSLEYSEDARERRKKRHMTQRSRVRGQRGCGGENIMNACTQRLHVGRPDRSRSVPDLVRVGHAQSTYTGDMG